MNRYHPLPILALGFLVIAVSAETPPTALNTQGRIAVDGVNFGSPTPTTGHFKFSLVGPGAGGTPVLWTNDGTGLGGVTSEPTGAVPITVSLGHYSVALGLTGQTNMTEVIPPNLFESNSEIYLRIWFSTTPGGPFELLTPDRRLFTSPFAFHAATAEGVPPDTITATELADGAVHTDALKNGAVTSAKIANGAVSPADIAPDAVQSVHLSNGSVGTAKLAPSAVNSSKIQNNSIAANDIAANAVGAPELANDAVDSAALQADAVTAAKLAPNSVDTSSIIDGSVLGIDLAGGITSGHLSVGAVDNSALAPGAVTNTKIALNAVTAVKIADGAVGSSEVQDNSVTSDDLADDVSFQTVEIAQGGSLNFDKPLFADEKLSWDETQSRFELTDDLALLGVLSAGSLVASDTPYHRLAADVTSFSQEGLNDASDLFIGDDLEVEATLFVGNIFVGAEELRVVQVGNSILGNGFLVLGEGLSEFLEWQDIGDRFYFSDDLEAASFITSSDRNLKASFEKPDLLKILEKVTAMEITTWQFKKDDPSTRHIGPMAQDFHAAFGFGGDDNTHIATVDADGIAFAAIQGLNAKLENENAELRKRLERLEALVDILTGEARNGE